MKEKQILINYFVASKKSRENKVRVALSPKFYGTLDKDLLADIHDLRMSEANPSSARELGLTDEEKRDQLRVIIDRKVQDVTGFTYSELRNQRRLLEKELNKTKDPVIAAQDKNLLEEDLNENHVDLSIDWGSFDNMRSLKIL